MPISSRMWLPWSLSGSPARITGPSTACCCAWALMACTFCKTGFGGMGGGRRVGGGGRVETGMGWSPGVPVGVPLTPPRRRRRLVWFTRKNFAAQISYSSVPTSGIVSMVGRGGTGGGVVARGVVGGGGFSVLPCIGVTPGAAACPGCPGGPALRSSIEPANQDTCPGRLNQVCGSVRHAVQRMAADSVASVAFIVLAIDSGTNGLASNSANSGSDAIKL